MAKITKTNKYFNTEEKLIEQAIRTVISSSAIEGIKVDEQVLRDHLKNLLINETLFSADCRLPTAD